MPPSLGLFGRKACKLPRLGYPVGAVDALALPARCEHVRVEHVDHADALDVDRDPTDALAGEEVSSDKVKRVPV